MFMFAKRETVAQSPLFDPQDGVSSSQFGQGAGEVQREMVRSAFQDLIRHTGVSAQSLECEVHSGSFSGATESLRVHLIVKKWSDHLMRHSFAFEKALVQMLDRYEPQVDHSHYEWLWKFDSACDYPYPGMPSAGEWSQKPHSKKNVSVAAPLSAKDVARAHVAAAQASHFLEFDLRDVFSDLKNEDFDPR
jgi:hypothetical protein